MSISRLEHITKIGVEDMGDLADRLDDPEVLRLENLDTDLRPPASALEHTRQAVDDDDANSYLPFFGLDVMRQAAVDLVGPAAVVANVARVSISNVVCQTGIAMGAVATAINDKDDGIASCVLEWQQRRDVLLQELKDFTVIPPHGGWSFLVDVTSLDMDGPEASRRLLDKGKIAATAMINWGGSTARNYIRMVFSNEPVDRLHGIGQRFRDALT